MTKAKYIIVVLVAICLASCSDSRIYDEVQKLPSDEWELSNNLEFFVNVSDTLAAYDILMHIRNNNSYSYSNLWMFVETTSPNGAIMRDTVEFYLADNSGRWLGKGIGSINSMLVPYKMNIRFPYRGIYQINVQQAMRTEVLRGIKDIGVQVQERK